MKTARSVGDRRTLIRGPQLQSDGNDKVAAAQPANLFEREWRVPWHAHVIPVLLAAAMAGLWLLLSHRQMAFWATSRQAIHDGRPLTLVLHIFAHGGAVHLLMNVAALVFVSGAVIARLGRPPLASLRYLYLFLGSGFAGAALFLALNRNQALLGSSGAIFGLVGALARMHPITGDAVPISSQRTWHLVRLFVQNHLLLFALVAVAALLTGGFHFLAWEAHLGGLLFGFLVAPLFLRTHLAHD